MKTYNHPKYHFPFRQNGGWTTDRSRSSPIPGAADPEIRYRPEPLSSSSLRGVPFPDRHEYFYFAADGSGGHTFSRTLREHNRAAQEYHRELDRRRREDGPSENGP